MPDVSGASWRFVGSSPLPRLVSKTASWSHLFPESVTGTMWLVASSCLGRAIAITGGHRLEYFVAKHKMVKESCGCMAHGQACEGVHIHLHRFSVARSACREFPCSRSWISR